MEFGNELKKKVTSVNELLFIDYFLDYLPNLLAAHAPVKAPIAPPIKKIDTIAAQSKSSAATLK